MLTTLTIQTSDHRASVEITETLKAQGSGQKYQTSRVEEVEPNTVRIIMANDVTTLLVSKIED